MQPQENGRRALGFLETRSLARGVVCADAMVKTAPVRLALLAPVSGGRMLVAVDGEVAAVEAALASGLDVAGDDVADALFIADLHPGVPAAFGPDAGREVGEALGLVETATAASAVRAADAALKAADVRLVRLRLARGIGGKGYLELTGTVSMVEAAVAAAGEAVEHPGFLLASEIIPALHADVRRWCARTLGGDRRTFDAPPGD